MKIPADVTSHDAYFDATSAEIRPLLISIQEKVESLLPEVTRCLSYKLPAFKGKRVFFYFAAFKNHIGIYPPVTKDTELIKVLETYRGPKGNLSFPLDKPLPLDLIGRVAIALYLEYDQTAS